MVVVLSNGVAQSASNARQAMLDEAVRHTTATGTEGGISEAGSAHRKVCKKKYPKHSFQVFLFCERTTQRCIRIGKKSNLMRVYAQFILYIKDA
jgi:hypothetical protein